MKVGAVGCGININCKQFEDQIRILAEAINETLGETLRKLSQLFLTVDEIQIALDAMKREGATYKLQIRCISKRQLKMINNKAIKRIVFSTPRESHRKVFLEEVEEDE